MSTRDELIAEVIRRYNLGDSAGVVARDMRLTRNQVVGIIDRARCKGVMLRGKTSTHRIPRKIKLPKAPEPYRPRHSPDGEFMKVLKKIDKKIAVGKSKGKAGNVYPINSLPLKPPSMPAQIVSESKGVPIWEVTGCRFAVTPHNVGPRDHLFCNKPCAEKQSYCSEHGGRLIDYSRGRNYMPNITFKAGLSF